MYTIHSCTFVFIISSFQCINPFTQSTTHSYLCSGEEMPRFSSIKFCTVVKATRRSAFFAPANYYVMPGHGIEPWYNSLSHLKWRSPSSPEHNTYLHKTYLKWTLNCPFIVKHQVKWILLLIFTFYISDHHSPERESWPDDTTDLQPYSPHSGKSLI